MDKLTAVVDNLTYQQEQQGCNRLPPHCKQPKPYKPYITKGRDNSSRDRSQRRDSRCDDQRRSFSRDRRGRNGDRDGSWRRFRKFDKSPSVKKSWSSSKPVNKDKDHCFRCHQHGHFTRECPQAAKDNKKETKELIQEVLREMKQQSSEDHQWDEQYGLNTFQHSQPALNM